MSLTYSQLASIPLFMGISGDDLAVILDRVELLDINLRPGEVFVSSGDVCQCMAIVREGMVRRQTEYYRGTFINSRKQETEIRYQIEELLKPGFILEPEILYGLENRHRNSWMAETSCQLTLIGKEDIRQTLMYVPVWRINLLNLLCTQLQRCQESVLHSVSPDEVTRTLQFFLNHATLGGESLETDITLEQMGYCLGISRRTMSSVITELEDQGLVRKSRQRIIVPDIGRLRLYNSSSNSH